MASGKEVIRVGTSITPNAFHLPVSENKNRADLPKPRRGDMLIGTCVSHQSPQPRRGDMILDFEVAGGGKGDDCAVVRAKGRSRAEVYLVRSHGPPLRSS